MAPLIATVFARCRNRAVGDAFVHQRDDQQHNQFHANNCGDDSRRNLWRDTVQRFWHERNTRRKPSGGHDLHRDRSNAAVFVQQCIADGRHCRNTRHHAHHLHYLYYAVVICLLAITPAWGEGNTTVVASPQSSSAGSVTNQAVQINQGSYNNQAFGSGLTCSGPTLVFTPFFIGASTYYEARGNANYGLQMSLSMPLDREAVSLCKAHARQKLSKERLDYELVRLLKCGEAFSAGWQISQSSPLYVLCADVVPVPKSGSISRVSAGSTSTPE